MKAYVLEFIAKASLQWQSSERNEKLPKISIQYPSGIMHGEKQNMDPKTGAT
jgi:hypothetical protein